MSKVPLGHLDQVGADRISGWAQYEGQSDPVVVELYVGGMKVWECLADQPRPDVESRGMPTGRCGFSISDNLVQGGNGARVFAKIRGASTFLGGSGRLLQPVVGPDPDLQPVDNRTTESGSNALGSLDSVTDGTITGWAAIEGQTSPITVEIYLDHRKLTECITGIERPDVTGSGKSIGTCTGFSARYDLSVAAYRSRIFAKVRGYRTPLPGSGKFPKPLNGKKLFFVHIPKTGGTTINEIAGFICERAQEHLEMFSNPFDAPAFEGFEFLSGHVSCGDAISTYKGRNFLFFTMLREPDAQFVSQLGHFLWKPEELRSNRQSSLEKEIAQALSAAGHDLRAQVSCLKSLSRDHLARPIINTFLDNSVTRHLASVDANSEVGPADVRRAQQVLAEIDLVGILSLFPQTLEKLSALTGRPWREHPAAWVNKEVGKALIAPGEQSRELFEQFVWADRRLYQTALSRFGTEQR